MAMLLSTIFAEDGSKGSSGAGKSQVAPGMQSQRSGGGRWRQWRNAEHWRRPVHGRLEL